MGDPELVKIFAKSIKNEFSFLKQDAAFYEAVAKGIPLPKNSGILVPINYAYVEDDCLISLLAKWREENCFAYPTKFKVTFEGTKNWLKEHVLSNSSRLLFLVVDRCGRWIGHV
ncbi:MAG: hypothetical protein ABSE81_06830, partial [Candidatus Omnitrophota bacterium]